jgi:tRNA (guanine37-N1)-methyltransferase
MVIRPEPLHNAIVDAKPGCVVYLTPQGRLFDHEVAKDLSRMDKLILLCGHYEGIDERIRECFVDDEISIGDYVLSCGEIPCLVVLDAVVRFLPGVLGDQDSVEKDSFSKHLLDYPSYTRPRNFQGLSVPPVLLSGHHDRIQEWRRQEALRRTFLRRPDLLEKIELSEEDVRFLKSLRRS